MNPSVRASVRFLLPGIALILLLTPAMRAGVSVTTFARIGGTTDGYHPQAGLIDGGDGAFYGTTEAGGPLNCGTVYRIAPDGTFATLYAFTGGSDGANPRSALAAGGDGFLYGTASEGGVNGTGTVFKISPAGAFTALHSFGALDAALHNADGADPLAPPVAGGDGNLYGTASSGGAAGFGVVYRLSPDGAFSTVYQFHGSSDGAVPKAALTRGGNGLLYGTASAAGAGGGTIFRVSPAGGFQVVYTFTNGTDGGGPASALVPLDGLFYGLTTTTFFSVTTTGERTTLHTFARSEAGPPLGGLTLGADGNFYGSATLGGNFDAGTVFRITPTGEVTVLRSFVNDLHGAYPAAAPVMGGDGNLYGVTADENGGTFIGAGNVYRLTMAGDLTTLRTFVAGGSYCVAGLLRYSDGNFYGVTANGGAKGGGTVFGVAADGSGSLTAYDLDPATVGSQPAAALTEGEGGILYGTARVNGSGGGGSFFTLVPVGGKPGITPTRTIYTFAPAPADTFAFSDSFGGATPTGYVIYQPVVLGPQPLAPDAGGTVVYGILQSGGVGGGGGIYSYAPGGAETLLHSFGENTSDGVEPQGLTASDGYFYGLTYGGGAADVGTVFKLALDGTYTLLYSFQGTGDGGHPQAGLVASDFGKLYGTTYAQYDAATGLVSNGTIFSITPDGTFTTLHTFAGDGSEGRFPKAALVQSAIDGNFYGTTSAGGAHDGGTLFSITPDGVFTNLYSFDPAHGGGAPEAPLITSSDGNLYGTTTTGGTDNAGVVYQVVLDVTPTVTVAATTPVTLVGSDVPGVFTFSISATPTTKLVVHYTLKGAAVNGTDYEYLTGKVKFKPGKGTSKTVQVVPKGDLGGAFSKKVKLVITPDDALFTDGTPGAVKVKIKQ